MSEVSPNWQAESHILAALLAHGSLTSIGHFIYQCKSTRPYVSRPSRTKLLEKPALLAKLNASAKTVAEVPEEFKTK